MCFFYFTVIYGNRKYGTVHTWMLQEKVLGSGPEMEILSIILSRKIGRFSGMKNRMNFAGPSSI